MKKPVIWVCSTVVVAILTSSVGSAQEIDVSMTLAQAEEAREEVVRANIQLTASETDEFWALYAGFRAELGPVQHELVNVVVEYSKIYTDISDAQATRLFDEWLKLRQQRTRIRTSYLKKFRSALGAKHAIRYAQLENKLDAAIDFDAARSIPLVD